MKKKIHVTVYFNTKNTKNMGCGSSVNQVTVSMEEKDDFSNVFAEERKKVNEKVDKLNGLVRESARLRRALEWEEKVQAKAMEEQKRLNKALDKKRSMGVG